ncbi:hypothetical protein TKV_c16130 [Thermoanaerobacter kivui]|jgi:Uma2 family endonuclease|uniref:Putative restriction endonuclease domain-containing protein n=1 Tax=Thermoanaerobacter kivui TaxID=2325 RepID=A0A097ASK8_THEKI|nr:Uma2 family endonuclease [Thermoanaerobacter kivui]AIS52772.1 hypothetical protein TKV_c16130 [Thermoanaerobacter kivui]MBZ4656233.1 hypothetical protein [Thermoanaerobacter sp.]MDK2815076.1 hypothetical protein [Thermoanaerobacter sp.]
MPLPKEDKIYTYADYLKWPENERIELINGQVYLMTPPSRIHQEILGAIFYQFYDYLKNRPCKVYLAPFGVRLPKGDEKSNEEIKTVVEPDMVVICDESKLDNEGCKGAPDLIVEIVSPSTRKRDRVEKFNLYEKHGVKEYWIVEPEDKIVSVFVLQENKRYGVKVYTDKDKIKVSLFDDLIIDLALIFNY